MKLSLSQLLNMVGLSQAQTEATPIHQFPYKNRVSMIGTVAAGKSTVLGGIVMTSETLCADDPNFFCRILEGTSEIHQDVSDLRDGHFPRKTVPFGAFATEAGLLMEWERKALGFQIGKKLLQVPICDVAGEDIAQMIRQVRVMSGPLGNIQKQAVRNLIAYVQESDGFIVTIKATRAKGLFPGGAQLETEQHKELSADPDVNLVRILEHLMNYKATHRSRPIKGIAVVITAWDMLKDEADKIGFDILNPVLGQSDLRNFVKGCFPAVYAAIKSLRIPNVAYFPSFFEVEKREDGSLNKWRDGSPKIKQRQAGYGSPDDWWRDLRKVSYSESSFVQLIEWLRQFAV